MQKTAVIIFYVLFFPSMLLASSFQDYFTEIKTLLSASIPHEEGAFLIPPESGRRPLAIYQDFAQSLKQLEILQNTPKPWLVYIAELGELAQVFLNAAGHLFQDEEFTAFQNDIKLAIAENTCHFEWFLTFMDALSIAVTSPDDRLKSYTTNTNYTPYRVELVRQILQNNNVITPEIYREKEKELGNQFTKMFASTSALSRLFPYLIALFYPFELDDEDIVMSLSTPTRPLWLVGLGLGKKTYIAADGVEMTRSMFTQHDLHHCAIWVCGLCTLHPKLATIDDDEKELFAHKIVLQDLKNYFFKSVEIMQAMLRDKIRLKKRVYVFFAFFLLHENISSAFSCLSALNDQEIMKRAVVTRNINHFLNKNFYYPLLPKEWQNSSAEEIGKNFSEYIPDFLKDFEAKAKSLFPHENFCSNLKKFINLHQDIYHNIHFDLSAYLISYMLELPNPEDKYRVIRILTQPLHDVNYGFFERFRENKIFVRFTFANPFLVSDKDLGSYLVEGFIQSYQKYLIPRIYIDDNITLLRAIAFGNVDEIKKLIKKGNDVNERNFLGETPLLACAAYRTCQIAKILLEANANILAVDSNNNSPIYLASERNNFDLVALLADARADLNAITNNKSPLSEALRRKDINMVKLLLEKGARTDISAERFSPSLNYALSVCPQAVPLLLEHKADPNSKEKKDGSASLCFAVTRDNFDAIRLLCAHKADPNQQDNNGITPLIWAMAYGKLEALKILLANGGDCFSKGPEGVSLYDCAKKLNLTDIIALFDEFHLAQGY